MNNLRLAKRILRMVGTKAKVVYGDEFCVEFFNDGSCPKITIVNEKMSLDAHEIISHKIFEKDFSLSNTNPHTMAVLHEIGHAKLNHSYCKDYVAERESISFLLNLGIIDAVEANKQYSQLKYERDANQWAVDFYFKNKKKLRLI
jgi:hypothetical protein